MPKKHLKENVLSAAKKRIEWTFDNFEKIYISFSGGKDSTVMAHLVLSEAKKRNRKCGLLFVDLEGQYKFTIDHVKEIYCEYSDIAEKFWICLPISLRNAVSVYEPKWVCWDDSEKNNWIRDLPKEAIHDNDYFDFFHKGMEFEEFVPLFGEWYAQNKSCACFVGIRADESLNRFRTIASKSKTTKKGKQWTTKVTDNVFNIYPIYDWKTQDIWTYHAKNSGKRYAEEKKNGEKMTDLDQAKKSRETRARNEIAYAIHEYCLKEGMESDPELNWERAGEVLKIGTLEGIEKYLEELKK